MQRRWQQAKAGEGSVVLVSGEPGIGKSRLAQTLLERLSGEPHTRLRLFCSPHHQDSALYPTITQLERAAGFRREDTAEQRLDKLEAVLARATNDLGEAVLLLAALLSLPAGGRYPPLDLTPQKQKEKTLRALVAQVEGLAARQPVLLLFEDAQWSDPTSLELLDLIIDRVPVLRVVLIITFRPEFTPSWTGRSHVSLLALNRLAPRQRAEMIAGVTGGKALPEEIADQIIDRTDGVPLFVEELTKAVVESGILTDAGDHYTAVGPVTPLAIPASLQASLLARLDRLAPVREVAQIGAALGRQFTHELIGAVAVPGSGPGTATAQLDDALAQLVGAELIYRRGTPPDADMLALASRGDLGGMSFGFRPVAEDWRDGGKTRELRAVELVEISVVSAWPAYEGTTVAARGKHCIPGCSYTPAQRRRFLEMLWPGATVSPPGSADPPAPHPPSGRSRSQSADRVHSRRPRCRPCRPGEINGRRFMPPATSARTCPLSSLACRRSPAASPAYRWASTAGPLPGARRRLTIPSRGCCSARTSCRPGPISSNG